MQGAGAFLAGVYTVAFNFTPSRRGIFTPHWKLTVSAASARGIANSKISNTPFTIFMSVPRPKETVRVRDPPPSILLLQHPTAHSRAVPGPLQSATSPARSGFHSHPDPRTRKSLRPGRQ